MKTAAAAAGGKSDRHLRRWVLNGLRAVHIAAVVGLGAQMLGAPATAWALPLVLGSGAGMLALDWWARRSYGVEATGLWIALKFALLASLALPGAHREIAYWSVVVGSVIVAHAPANFRHLRWLGHSEQGKRN